MEHKQGTFDAADGLQLFEQCWLPESADKAVVVIVHGYAEHSGRYENTAKYLVAKGYSVYTFDLRGHGRSEGERAFVSFFDEYLLDLKRFLTRVKKKEDGKQVFLLGHSLGGTIVALLGITGVDDIRGMILSNALLRISNKISLLVRVFMFITREFYSKLPVLNKIDCRLLSHDPEVVAAFDKDPLVYHGRLLTGEALEINRAVRLIRKRMESISLPLLILQGTADALVDPKGSSQLYKRATSDDKILKVYEGFFHELFNELGKEQVLADVVKWLDSHI